MYRDVWKKITAIVVTVCLAAGMIWLPGSSLKARDAGTYHTYRYGESEPAGQLGAKRTAAVFMTGQNTSGGAEIIEGVTFDVYMGENPDEDAKALVELYTSPNPGDPASGTYAGFKEINGLTEGTNRVSFEDFSLKLVKGECFSVIVTVEGENISFYTDEFTEEQRTFAETEDGIWYDLSDEGQCAVIYAFTSDEKKAGFFKKMSALIGGGEPVDETEQIDVTEETEADIIEGSRQADISVMSDGEGDLDVDEPGNIFDDNQPKADITNIADADITLPDGVNYRHTGTAIRPAVVVSANGRNLYPNSDYTVAYDNNVEVGTGNITITGINSYTGSASLTFNILPYNVSLDDVTVTPIPDEAFTGSPVYPAVTLTYLGSTLRQDIDYTVTYENNLYAGIATATIHGNGQYAGSRRENFNIVPHAMEEENVVIVDVPDQAYTGDAVTPELSVHYGDYQLAAGRDYIAAYSNNTEIGTATVVLQGQNNFKGSKSVQFSIVSNSMQDAEIEGIEESYSYTGTKIQPDGFTVKIGKKILKEDTDYIVSYGDNTQVGTGTVIVRGTGFYRDNIKEVTFRIVRKDISDDDVEIEGFIDSFLYTGSPMEQNITVRYGTQTLIRGTDYNVQYLRNVEIGTASMVLTGIGNYAGNRQMDYAIYLESAIDSEVVIENMSSVYVYTGEEIRPQPTLTRRGMDLREGTDYNLEFENNINAGIAVMRIVGINNCPGVREETFTIFKRSIHLADVSTIGLQFYTGNDIEPAVTASDGGRTLSPGTDYVINYRLNREPGTAVAVVKGINNYTAAREIRFEIRPGDVSSIDVAATTLSSATISWSSGGASTGYEIFRAGPDGQYQRVARKIGTSYTDTNLTAGDLYYYRVRAYYVTASDTYYGSFSPVTRAIAR